jgi:hypothetical protein
MIETSIVHMERLSPILLLLCRHHPLRRDTLADNPIISNQERISSFARPIQVKKRGKEKKRDHNAFFETTTFGTKPLLKSRP